MLHINRVTLLGHAGRDPELRTMRSGEAVASFSLATTQKWKRQDGQPGEATEWHRIVVYGAAVKAVGEMVAKGAAVLVEGRLAVRPYKDKEGVERQGDGDRRRRSPGHGQCPLAKARIRWRRCGRVRGERRFRRVGP